MTARNMSWRRYISREIAESFDADRMDREMAALVEAIQAPGAGAGTAYYRYAHYVTIVPSERDGEPFYWFVYHSAPEDGGDAAEAASEPATQAEPEPQAEQPEQPDAPDMGT